MAKDWKGNSKAVFASHAAIGHTDKKRVPNDYYATDPKNLEELLEYETFSKRVWECACGGGIL